MGAWGSGPFENDDAADWAQCDREEPLEALQQLDTDIDLLISLLWP